jgi:hypothetical protein
MRAVPRWHLLLFRLQIVLVYAFAGLAKLSSSDWLRGYPIRELARLSYDAAFEDVIGVPPPPGSSRILPELFTFFIAGGGVVFDCLVGPALLGWAGRRARRAALWCSAAFHGCNFFLFEIGVFPFLMLATSVLFLEEDEDGAARMDVDPKRKKRGPAGDPRRAGDPRPLAVPVPRTANPLGWRATLATLIFCAHFCAQTVLPLRHYAYQKTYVQLTGVDAASEPMYGDPRRVHVNWTGLGELWAWRMMLTSKRCDGAFRVTFEDAELGSTKRTTRRRAAIVSPKAAGLTPTQQHRVFQYPGYIRQAAFEAARRRARALGARGGVTLGARVFCHRCVCDLNGSGNQPFARDDVDLLTLDDGWAGAQALVLPQTKFV